MGVQISNLLNLAAEQPTVPLEHLYIILKPDPPSFYPTNQGILGFRTTPHLPTQVAAESLQNKTFSLKSEQDQEN